MQHSPWGKPQSTTIIIPGILIVTTASHGGIHVNPTYQKRIPAYMRSANGWYEEDSQWSIPYVALEHEIRNQCPDTDRELHNKNIAAAHETLKGAYWRFYELFFNTELRPGESMSKDEEQWQVTNRNEYQVLSAWGDWHESVPTDMVALYCQLGGRDNPHGLTRYFLVPSNCYTGGHFLAEYSYHRMCAPIQ